MSHEREQIVRTADRVRDDLMMTLRELERRKDETFSVRLQLERHRAVLQWAAVGVGTLAVVGIGAALLARHRAERRLPRTRIEAIARAWNHPERLATKAQEAPALQRLIQKAGIAMLVAFATQAARRSAAVALPVPSSTPSRQIS